MPSNAWLPPLDGAKSTWATVLISCLIGPAQQAVDAVPLADLNDYDKIRTAILKMLNLNPEAYRRCLHKISFGPDYQLCAVVQQIRAAGLRWLHPESQTKEQVIKAILVEHFTMILPFKRKNWVLCHQPDTLEEVIMLMEAYASAEAAVYLIPRSWKRKAEFQKQQSARGQGTPMG